MSGDIERGAFAALFLDPRNELLGRITGPGPYRARIRVEVAQAGRSRKPGVRRQPAAGRVKIKIRPLISPAFPPPQALTITKYETPDWTPSWQNCP